MKQLLPARRQKRTISKRPPGNDSYLDSQLQNSWSIFASIVLVIVVISGYFLIADTSRTPSYIRPNKAIEHQETYDNGNIIWNSDEVIRVDNDPDL